MTVMSGADMAFPHAVSMIHLRPISPTAEEENHSRGQNH